jgi:uncharacterized membrane protein YbhN (UPF0104 family)
MLAVLNSRKLNIALSILLFLSVLWLFFYYRAEMFKTIRGLKYPWIFAGLICFGANYFSRAIRLRFLADNTIAIWPTGFYCASFHGFATYMLPMRTGEFSLPIILKTTSGIDIKKGLGILYRARLLDLLTLGVWMIAAFGLSSSSLSFALRWKMALAGIAMVSLPLFIRKFARIRWLKIPKIQNVIQLVGDSSRLQKKDILSSFAIWIAIGMGLWCVTEAMHLDISFGEMVLLIAVQILMQFIPVQGLANTGNHEGGWVFALTLLGYSVESAVEFALVSHLLIMFYVSILGLVAVSIRYAVQRKSK